MIGQVARFWSIMRELNVDELERDLAHPLSVRLSGNDAALIDWVEGLLFRDGDIRIRRVVLPAESVVGGADLELLVVPGGRVPTQAEISAAHTLLSRGTPAVLVIAGDHWAEGELAGLPEFPPEHIATISPSDEAEARYALVRMLVDAAPTQRLALARRFPAFRTEVAEQLIRETSSANAQFALMSSVPAVLPVLGGLLGDMADMLVLTKNQALLLVKLAGIHGRDLSDKTRLAAEIVPVVGSAFVWRSLARSAIGLLPVYASALPKTAVAYAGTYTVGAIASYYYTFGHRPPPAVMRRIGEEGSRLFRAAAKRLGRGSGNDHAD